MRVFAAGVVGILASSGCINATAITCGDLTCPSTDVCTADHKCVLSSQLDACTGIADGQRCTFGDSVGFCHVAACYVSLEVCGDGVSQISENELCDCGTADLLAAPPVGCNGFNSTDPGATCRPDCGPARCGDGIVDPDELCDDGNTIPFDGCRADCQGRFQPMRTPTFQALFSVFAFGPTNAYAVGGDVIHYDGVSWSDVDVPTSSGFSYVWGLAPDDIFVAGSDHALNPTVLHFDGSTWTSITVPSNVGELSGFWASSASDIYIIVDQSGDTALIHYDGHSWTAPNFFPCATGGEPGSIFGTSASSVYMGTNSGLCYWDGSKWSLIDPDIVTMIPVSGATTAIGFKPNTQTFWRWTGTTGAAWTAAPSYTLPVYGSMISATPAELFIIGAEGLVLDFDGTQWTALTSPTQATLRAVSGTSASDVFIVGDNGTVLH